MMGERSPDYPLGIAMTITLDLIADTEITCPPTDLWSDEPPVESDLHLQQIILLLTCLEWLWRERSDYYASGNLTIYYNEAQLKKRDFCGPDFFVVLETEKRPRKSWVVWGEGGKYPHLIVEVLSKSTAKVDRTAKKELYQNTFRTPEYFWFDPNTLEFQGFCLVTGHYQALEPNHRGHLWSEQLGLFFGVHNQQLRYFDPDGVLIPTPQEVASQAMAAKNSETLRADKLAAKLRELGLDPEAIA